MKISTFKHFTSDATKSLSRNKTLSFASIATVATTLLILGVFMMVVLNVRIFMDEIGSNMEVRVYLNDDITIEQKQDLLVKIKNSEGYLKCVEFNKDEAAENFMDIFGKNSEDRKQAELMFSEYLDKNPLPVELRIFAKDSKYIDGIAENIEGMEGIEAITVAKDIIEKLTQISTVIKVTSIIILVLLFVVSIFLIMNTIKIAVYSRSREINIMKYVGATDWFIRWPFIIEGIIIGLIGGMVALVLLYGIYAVLFNMMQSFGAFGVLVNPVIIIKQIMPLFAAGGALIGSLGSVLSIRKFLKV